MSQQGHERSEEALDASAPREADTRVSKQIQAENRASQAPGPLPAFVVAVAVADAPAPYASS